MPARPIFLFIDGLWDDPAGHLHHIRPLLEELAAKCGGVLVAVSHMEVRRRVGELKDMLDDASIRIVMGHSMGAAQMEWLLEQLEAENGPRRSGEPAYVHLAVSFDMAPVADQPWAWWTAQTHNELRPRMPSIVGKAICFWQHNPMQCPMLGVGPFGCPFFDDGTGRVTNIDAGQWNLGHNNMLADERVQGNVRVAVMGVLSMAAPTGVAAQPSGGVA